MMLVAAAALAVPLAGAEVASLLELSLEDDAGDSRRHRDGGPARAGLDLVRFESRVEGAEVVQRVTFAGTDWYADDIVTFSLVLGDGTYGEDLRLIEVVHTFERDRFHSYGSLRTGPRESAAPIRAETSLENASVVLRLDLSAFEGATCFDPHVRVEHGNLPRANQPDVSGSDSLARAEPTCSVAEGNRTHGGFEAPPMVGYRMPENPPSGVAPPGTRAPVPSPTPLVLVAMALAVAFRSGQERRSR